MFLALDSSTLTLSLALVEGRGPGVRLVEGVDHGPPRKVSQMLPGAVTELLERHRVRLESLEGIAVGLGPGSFTGLRVGLATAKGLAYAAGIPLCGVGSLAAAALEGPEGVPLLPCAVARKGELYVGRFARRGLELDRVAPEEAIPPAELASWMQKEPASVALGPAIAEYRGELLALGVAPGRLLGAAPWPPALDVARLAALPEKLDLQALFALEPYYVRPSEAERNPKFPPLPGPAPVARIKED